MINNNKKMNAEIKRYRSSFEQFVNLLQRNHSELNFDDIRFHTEQIAPFRTSIVFERIFVDFDHDRVSFI